MSAITFDDVVHYSIGWLLIVAAVFVTLAAIIGLCHLVFGQDEEPKR